MPESAPPTSDGRQPDGVVAEAVAVDVAELGDRRERAVAVRDAEGRQRRVGSAPVPTALSNTPKQTIAAVSARATRGFRRRGRLSQGVAPRTCAREGWPPALSQGVHRESVAKLALRPV